MTRYFLVATILIATSIIGNCQNIPTCKDLRKMVFFQYIKNSNEHYIIYEDDNYEKDVNEITGDTTLLQNDWLSDSIYSQKLISSNDQRVVKATKFFKKHKIVNEITTIASEYLVLNVYLDKIGKKPIATDTLWFNPKAIVPDTRLFEHIPAEPKFDASSFKDTSKYALLYFVRPSNIWGCAISHPVYCNDIFMCSVRNNSGYVFKIFREGTIKLAYKEKHCKAQPIVSLDIKFGKSYYFYTKISGGLAPIIRERTGVYRLSKTIGEKIFSKVRVR